MPVLTCGAEGEDIRSERMGEEWGKRERVKPARVREREEARKERQMELEKRRRGESSRKGEGGVQGKET